MQFTTIITLAAAALSTTLGVVAQVSAPAFASESILLHNRTLTDGAIVQDATTLWVPMATMTEVQTFTGTRVEEVWTDVAPYEWLTTFPITWTATETQTQFMPIVTTMAPADRRHARDFQQEQA